MKLKRQIGPGSAELEGHTKEPEIDFRSNGKPVRSGSGVSCGVYLTDTLKSHTAAG